MAYEREAIADSTSAVPTPVPAVMREEVTFNPYKPKTKQENVSATGQVDKTRDSSTVETSPAAETVTLSPQVAALARREQKFRQQQQTFNEQQKALETQKAELADLMAMKAKLAAKDYSGLEGQVDYEAYTQYLLNKESSMSPEQQALKKLEAEVEGVKKTQQDNISKQFEAAVNERRTAVTKLVETDQQFASIKELNLQEAVVQHILDTWEHDSKELSVEDAAKEVEELLMERANKWAALSKLKPKEPAVEEKKQLPPLKSGLKTITNQVTTGEIKKPAKSFQHMSDNERWAEARRRAEEKLQKQG